MTYARISRARIPTKPGADGWNVVKTAITITTSREALGARCAPHTVTLIVTGADEANAAYTGAVAALRAAGFEVEEGKRE